MNEFSSGEASNDEAECIEIPDAKKISEIFKTLLKVAFDSDGTPKDELRRFLDGDEDDFKTKHSNDFFDDAGIDR